LSPIQGPVDPATGFFSIERKAETEADWDMNHRIFAGAFNALEPRFIEEIRLMQQDDPLTPVPVLIGSNILSTYLRRQIAVSGHAAANVRFFNFLDLARLLSGQPAKPLIPGLGASAILESLLAESTPEAFSAVSGFPGFRDALLDTFRDLRDAGIAPDTFRRSLRPWLQSAPDRSLFLEGIAELYARFRAKVTLFHDVDADFQAAAGRTCAAPDLLGSKRILLYGIYDVTGQQDDFSTAWRNSWR
jgi:hypothetical protein